MSLPRIIPPRRSAVPVISDLRRLRSRARAIADPERRAVIRLWAPLTPLFLLLSPFALIASPLLGAFRPTRRVSPFRAAIALGGVLLALRGTQIQIESRKALISIRIF